jgi:hypothetical protein
VLRHVANHVWTSIATCCVLQDKNPDYDSYCMLAEAYMSLQEPDKAAAAYEVGTCHERFCPLSPARPACNDSGLRVLCVGATKSPQSSLLSVPALALQSALGLRPKDSNLAVLAANAYVAAHDYNRAIDHYNRCAPYVSHACAKCWP